MKDRLKRTAAAVLAALACTACAAKQSESAVNDSMAPYINMRQYEFYTEVGQPLNFSTVLPGSVFSQQHSAIKLTLLFFSIADLFLFVNRVRCDFS